MPTTREIRRRIRGVSSTAQITRAMEMVAASKMRRAQSQALASRPYAAKMDEVLGHLAAVTAHTAQGDLPHPLLRRREPKAIGLVLITPDGGFAGGMTTNLIQRAASFTLAQSVPTKIVAVGRKGSDWMKRHGGLVVADFNRIGDRPTLIDTLGVSHAVIDGYCEGQFDEVYILYCDFVSTLVQRPTMRRLLPVEIPETESNVNQIDYIYEPDPSGVLAELLPRYVEMDIYHAVLESKASEESARMVAMRNATDNANEIIKELTLTYNRARQAVITNEIAEIAAAEAVLK